MYVSLLWEEAQVPKTGRTSELSKALSWNRRKGLITSATPCQIVAVILAVTAGRLFFSDLSFNLFDVSSKFFAFWIFTFGLSSQETPMACMLPPWSCSCCKTPSGLTSLLVSLPCSAASCHLLNWINSLAWSHSEFVPWSNLSPPLECHTWCHKKVECFAMTKSESWMLSACISLVKDKSEVKLS